MLTRYPSVMWLPPPGRVGANSAARGLCSIVIAALLPLLAACGTLPPQPTTAVDAAPSADAVEVPDGMQSSDTPAAIAPETEGAMEKTRGWVRSAVEWIASGVDGWFGEIPVDKSRQVTDGRLDFNFLKREIEGTDVSLRFNAQFWLPNLEKSAYAFVGRDNQREVVADVPGALTRQQRLAPEAPEDRSFFAGLGLPLADVIDFRLGFRGGLKPYAQARYRRLWQMTERDSAEFRETVFWTLNDQFGSTTTVTFDHAITSTLLLRWVNGATITQQTRNYGWSSNLGAYKDFGAQRLLALEALVGKQPNSGVTISDYGLQTRWEQPMYKDWLLGELIVGYSWPRKDASSEREQSWALGFNLKMRF